MAQNDSMPFVWAYSERCLTHRSGRAPIISHLHRELNDLTKEDRFTMGELWACLTPERRSRIARIAWRVAASLIVETAVYANS